MFFTLEPQKNTTEIEQPVYDFLSLGGGPAGLNGALYARRKGLKTAVVAHELGGQLRNTSFVDNYLGFENIDAKELMDKFLSHVRSLDIPLITGIRISGVEKNGPLFHVKLEDGRILKSKTLLAAFGGSPRKLGVPGEDRLYGKGVSYCATCDAPFFKNKHVVVAGGGNSAVEAALDLAKWASQVTILHRSRFRADQTILDRMASVKNLDFRLETQIIEVLGADKLTGLRILDKTTRTESLFSAEGLFVEIGTLPNSSLFASLAERNETGELLVDAFQRTSCEGLYAAGDITPQPHRQIIIAAAEGAKAALEASRYLHQKG
jgi:thioredoxin-disulfide reductase